MIPTGAFNKAVQYEYIIMYDTVVVQIMYNE